MTKIIKTLVIALFVLCAITISTSNAESGEEAISRPVADVAVGANGIGFMPKVDYAQMVLTVSTPDGTVFSKTFGSGESPFIGLAEISVNGLFEGTYIYELRVIPRAADKVRGETNRSESYASRTLTQSGSFWVQGGAIAVPGMPETGISRPRDDISTTQDICYNDDLIVDGSLCVGFDCTCNYSFGFDTIVLKENNLRIFFDDTSVAASYPRNDWRIVINDSANGGASYFGVEDSTGGRRVFTLEAGAPSHSLFVDDGGRVGFGTSTPSVELHVVDGDTPALRLQQDGSSGFAPQTFDVAGNETNFFIRDVTNGSTLPFRIQPDAPSSALTIRSDGKIGMGTWSPGFALELERTGTAATFVCDQTDGATAMISAGGNYVFIGGKSDHDFRLLANDAPVMTLEPGGDVGIGTTNPGYKLEIVGGAYCDGGAWMPGSSREYKENITNLTLSEATDALNELNPVKFNYKTSKTKEDYIGFIAEDVPQLVATQERKSVSPMDVVAVLTKVLKEQQTLLKEQQASIAELKKEIAELKKK